MSRFRVRSKVLVLLPYRTLASSCVQWIDLGSILSFMRYVASECGSRLSTVYSVLRSSVKPTIVRLLPRARGGEEGQR